TIPRLTVTVSGGVPTWSDAADGGLTFRFNTEMKDGVSVSVDGVLLGKNGYETSVETGAITLLSSYLQGLTAGEHTLSVVSALGETQTVFVVEKSSGKESKKENGAAEWIGGGLIGAGSVAAIGAVYFFVAKRKRR
ncbi:MAG: hypothetical protein IJB97_04715, partial [Clostridia bacterium]|nr:hypothetical protein [Clostridia bacterium]